MRTLFTFALLFLLTFVQCASISEGTSDKTSEMQGDERSGSQRFVELTASDKALLASSNSFGFELFRIMAAEQKGENLFFSPLSIYMALSMAYNGAAGTTQEALAEALDLYGFTEEQLRVSWTTLTHLMKELDPEVEVGLANSIWFRAGYTLNQTFVDLSRSCFGAEIATVDFGDPQTAAVINGWVKDMTRGKITDMVNSAALQQYAMLLLNAIYFKGNWDRPFDEMLTAPASFYREDGTTTTVNMMFNEARYRYYENGLYQALDIPYGEGDYYMTIILPGPDCSVNSVMSFLDASSWSKLMDSFSYETVSLSLPRFNLEYETDLKHSLSAMGLATIFTPEADFGGMLENGNVWIGEAKHKAVIEVNEKGTEAAASTSIGFVTSYSPPLEFQVDRPFVLAIREAQSQTVLFAGKVMAPAQV